MYYLMLDIYLAEGWKKENRGKEIIDLKNELASPDVELKMISTGEKC